MGAPFSLPQLLLVNLLPSGWRRMAPANTIHRFAIMPLDGNPVSSACVRVCACAGAGEEAGGGSGGGDEWLWRGGRLCGESGCCHSRQEPPSSACPHVTCSHAPPPPAPCSPPPPLSPPGESRDSKLYPTGSREVPYLIFLLTAYPLIIACEWATPPPPPPPAVYLAPLFCTIFAPPPHHHHRNHHHRHHHKRDCWAVGLFGCWAPGRVGARCSRGVHLLHARPSIRPHAHELPAAAAAPCPIPGA